MCVKDCVCSFITKRTYSMCCSIDVNQLGWLFNFLFLLNGKIYKNWRLQPESQWRRPVSREVFVRGRKISSDTQCYNIPLHINALHKTLGLIWPAHWQIHTQAHTCTRAHTGIRQRHYICCLFPVLSSCAFYSLQCGHLLHHVIKPYTHQKCCAPAPAHWVEGPNR